MNDGRLAVLVGQRNIFEAVELGAPQGIAVACEPPHRVVLRLLLVYDDAALIERCKRTGLRWGECAGLRWDAVDLAAGVVRVVRVAEEISGHVSLKPYPKSKAGRGSVPLPGFVVELLTVTPATTCPAHWI